MSVGAAVLNYVGGKIFYIDDTATGTYTFKNGSGETVSAPSVGTDCTGWTYEVSGGNGKDKYYVADLTNRTYLNRKYDGLRYVVFATNHNDIAGWPDYEQYLQELDENGNNVDSFGVGRLNSEWIKTHYYNNAFYPKTTESSITNMISVWDIMEEANAAKANGCEDWYCPSIGELEQLKDPYGHDEWIDSIKVVYTAYLVWSSSFQSGGCVQTYQTQFNGNSGSEGSQLMYFDATQNSVLHFACILIRSF